MTVSTAGEVTRLLRSWSEGDPSALEKLVPLVCGELHRLLCEGDISGPGENNEQDSQRPEPTAQARIYLEDNGAPRDQPQTCDVNN